MKDRVKLFGRCYKHIDDLPIHNWQKIINSGDLSHLLFEKRKVSEAEQIALQNRWKSLYDQYIAEFGFGETFLQILEMKKEIAQMMIDKAETEDGIIATFIGIKEQEVQLKEKEIVKSDYFETKAFMEKRIGFQIDAKKMSVMEFYKTLKSLEKKSTNH